MGRKVRGHEHPARLGAGRGLGGLFEPIPAGAGGGSRAGSSHAHLCKARGPCTQLVEEEVDEEPGAIRGPSKLMTTERGALRHEARPGEKVQKNEAELHRAHRHKRVDVVARGPVRDIAVAADALDPYSRSR